MIYPRWPKLGRQTEFHLPPHGPVVMAAALPPEVAVTFVDENVQELDLDDRPDAVAVSMMLTSQVRRGWEIADAYRRRERRGSATQSQAKGGPARTCRR